MGDISRRGEEISNTLWREVRKRYVDIEHQKMEANV
jgi:hypothetical protein